MLKPASWLVGDSDVVMMTEEVLPVPILFPAVSVERLNVGPSSVESPIVGCLCVVVGRFDFFFGIF